MFQCGSFISLHQFIDNFLFKMEKFRRFLLAKIKKINMIKENNEYFEEVSILSI